MAEQRFAVLIASSKFPEEPRLQSLRLPENDVDGINEIFTSEVHGPFTETVVLKNRPSHEVTRRVNQVLSRAEKDDLVLIYYSGHGKLNRAGQLHLATIDTVLDTLETTSVPVQTIKSLIDVTRSSKVVLFLDCCYSGAIGSTFMRSGVDDQLQLMSGGRGTYIMTASTGIQVALEKDTDQYGVFTKHIIEGIRGGEADQNSSGQITMDELYHYVRGRMREEGGQEPMRWDLNVSGGELVIARSGKTPREERRNQLREMLLDLARNGVLPDGVVSEAIQLIALNPTQFSEGHKRHDALLEQLLQKKIRVGDFIHGWYQVTAAPPKPEAKPPAAPPVAVAEAQPMRRQLPEEGAGKEPVRSFWTTLPGILSGIAVVIVAITGLVVGLYAAGILGNSTPQPTSPAATPPTPIPAQVPVLVAVPTPTPTATPAPAKAPEAPKAQPAATTAPAAKPAAPAAPAAATPTPTPKPAAGATLGIASVGEEFKFDTTKLSAKAGTVVALIFKNRAKTPGLQHNWVLVKAGTKDQVAVAGTTAGPTNNWIPQKDDRVITNTKLVDPGKTGEVQFTVPAAGTYQFVCTFPGHNITMFGEFTAIP